ncbi:uncharacterized protein LOC117104648 [Anneissia japonica]|uniref:uncharacterized protein LOC117104648 n=1 Tax=Anneissia japonica TaxID=1529436 RepID=UPI001425A243|nr:uncharacterized protein LOC117104648 [Anneissia japonica]
MADSPVDSILPRKALFRSPSMIEENVANDPQLNRHQIDQDTELKFKQLKRELHEQRLEELKKELGKLNDTEWMHEPVEKLIGLK